MVHVKKSAICRLAYIKVYMEIFVDDVCHLKCIGIQAQRQEM